MENTGQPGNAHMPPGQQPGTPQAAPSAAVPGHQQPLAQPPGNARPVTQSTPQRSGIPPIPPGPFAIQQTPAAVQPVAAHVGRQPQYGQQPQYSQPLHNGQPGPHGQVAQQPMAQPPQPQAPGVAAPAAYPATPQAGEPHQTMPTSTSLPPQAVPNAAGYAPHTPHADVPQGATPQTPYPQPPYPQTNQAPGNVPPIPAGPFATQQPSAPQHATPYLSNGPQPYASQVGSAGIPLQKASTPGNIIAGQPDRGRPVPAFPTPAQNLAGHNSPRMLRDISVGDALGAAWKGVRRNSLKVFALAGLSLVVFGFCFFPMFVAKPGSATSQHATVFASVVLLPAIWAAVVLYMKAAYDLARDGQIRLSGLFSGYNIFAAVGVAVGVGVVVNLATQFLIIPGLIVGALTMFAQCSQIHRNAGFSEAFSESAAIVKSNARKYGVAYIGLNLVFGVFVGGSMFLLSLLLPTFLVAGATWVVLPMIIGTFSFCVAITIATLTANACLYLNAVGEPAALK